jgi:DNA-binding CsgD family transcriptional regulator
MPGREAARQAAGEPLLYPQQGPLGVGPRLEAAEPHPGSGAPISSGVSRCLPRGGLDVVPGGYGAARGGSRLVDHNPRETSAALAPVRDGPVPRAHLLWAAAALLLEVVADDAPGDPDASALALVHGLGPAEPDRLLFPALIQVALALFQRRASLGVTETSLASEIAGLLGEVKRSAPPSAEPAWPGEPLTESETHVLRYLPTHMGALEIAAELFVSGNTVKTHLRHLYRKLGAHSRHEAVQRARVIGLLTVPGATGSRAVSMAARGQR